MARPLRIEYPGAYYHVYHRGIERRKIYQSAKDYALFLHLLEQSCTQFNFIIHAYCLMSNHYHLFIETPAGNLSRGLRHINGVYTQKYNHRYKRVGALFQGRYKAKLVDANSYSLELVRYIHMNPVEAKMVKRPEAYPYSSYKNYIGKGAVPAYLATSWILSQFSKRRSEAVRELKRFTLREEGRRWEPEEKTLSRVVLGSEKFFEKIRDKYLAGREDKELSELRTVKRTVSVTKIEKFIQEMKGSSIEKRKWLIYALRKHTPLKLEEIAQRTNGKSYSSISQTVRRLEQEAREKRSVAKILSEIDTQVSKVKT